MLGVLTFVGLLLKLCNTEQNMACCISTCRSTGSSSIPKMALYHTPQCTLWAYIIHLSVHYGCTCILYTSVYIMGYTIHFSVHYGSILYTSVYIMGLYYTPQCTLWAYMYIIHLSVHYGSILYTSVYIMGLYYTTQCTLWVYIIHLSVHYGPILYTSVYIVYVRGHLEK